MGRPLIFCADSHLDTGAWANRPVLRNDSMQAFESICTLAVRKQAEAVIGAGDLIDVRKPPPEVVNFVRTKMDELSYYGIAFYYIQGQHEYSQGIPWFSAIHKHPQSINYKTVQLSGLRVYGLDWHPADKLSAALATIPPNTNVLVMHQVWEEFMCHLCTGEGSFANIDNTECLFTGDFHVNREQDYHNASMRPLRVISPGSTHIRKIDEPEDKYVYLMDGNWRRWQLPTRRKFDMQIMSERALAAFPGNFENALVAAQAKAEDLQLASELRTPLCRITYLDSLPDVFSIIKDVVGDTVELFLKPIPKVPDTTYVDKQQFTTDVRGLADYLTMCVPKMDARYLPLLRLIRSNEKKVELQTMKRERGLL